MLLFINLPPVFCRERALIVASAHLSVAKLDVAVAIIRSALFQCLGIFHMSPLLCAPTMMLLLCCRTIACLFLLPIKRSLLLAPRRASDVTKVNAAVEEDPTLEGLSVEELMTTTDGAVFNSAAQVRARRKLCGAVASLQPPREEVKRHCYSACKRS